MMTVVVVVAELVGNSVSVEMIVLKDGSISIHAVAVNAVSAVVPVVCEVNEVCVTVDVRVSSLVCVESVDGRNVLVNVSSVEMTGDESKCEDEPISATVGIEVRPVISIGEMDCVGWVRLVSVMIDDRTVDSTVVSVFVTTVGRSLVAEVCVTVCSVLVDAGVLVDSPSVKGTH